VLVPGRPVPGLIGPCPDRGEGGGRARRRAPLARRRKRLGFMDRRALPPEPPRPEPSPPIRALRSPGFRRFLAARTISQRGDTFNTVAIVILVYQLTSSG
jgi:hypothetical protein